MIVQVGLVELVMLVVQVRAYSAGRSGGVGKAARACGAAIYIC